jgi:hypothetical protein
LTCGISKKQRKTVPYQPGQSGNREGRPKGALNKATREAKEFAEKFLCSPAYRKSARERVLAGEANHLEVLWHHYAFGKPKETVQIDGELPPFRLVMDDDDVTAGVTVIPPVTD